MLLKVHPDTLEQWRSRGVGPKWIKLGESPQSPIRYKASVINEYLQDQENK